MMIILFFRNDNEIIPKRTMMISFSGNNIWNYTQRNDIWNHSLEMILESFSKEWYLKSFPGNDIRIIFWEWYWNHFLETMIEIVPFGNDDGIVLFGNDDGIVPFENDDDIILWKWY